MSIFWIAWLMQRYPIPLVSAQTGTSFGGCEEEPVGGPALRMLIQTSLMQAVAFS
ncbi:MAG: hypothetical protein ACD_36C00159G0001 [uncultured bacterium]|nr:MAG: hypothetical protein ACD_36C00159G0001 [uncultured bacterium]